MKVIVRNIKTEEVYAINEPDLNKDSKVIDLKKAISKTKKLNLDEFKLIFNEQMLDGQYKMREYGMKNFEEIDLLQIDSKFKNFRKNVGKILFFGFIFGVGHYLASSLINYNLKDLVVYKK